MSRLLSILLFVVCAGLMTAALITSWPEADPGDSRNAVQVQPGATVDFAVPPGTARLRLVTSAIVGPDVPPLGRMQQDYRLDLVWETPWGEVRRRETVHARSRVSRWPSATTPPRWSTRILDDEALLTDPRDLLLPILQELPGGGTMSLTAPADGPPLLVRAYSSNVAPETSRAKADAIERSAARVGVKDLDDLDPAERQLALAHPWRSLAYSDQQGGTSVVVRVRHDAPPLSLIEDGASGTTLLPGQAVALTVRGPARIQVAGHQDLAALELSARWDLPPGAERAALSRRRVAPLPLPGVQDTFEVDLPTDAVVSLSVKNPTRSVLGPLLFALAEPRPEQGWGWTVVVPQGELDLGDDRHLLGPERVEVPAFHIGPETAEPILISVPSGQPTLLLRTRAELNQGSDFGPRTLTVEELGADGQVLASTTLDVQVEPAPYERRSEDGGWLSEPVDLPVTPSVQARRLRLTSRHAQRLVPYVEGPIVGEFRYDLAQADLIVRYGREAPSRWHRLWPENVRALGDAGQLTPFLANPRLEPFVADPDAGERRYTALEPKGRTAQESGRTWLLPGISPEGEAWCRYAAGDGDAPLPWDLEARARRGGELMGFLHAARPGDLGSPYAVVLDGRRWRQGVLTQTVEPLRSVFERSHRSARLEAPVGTELWMRVLGQGGCPDPHRGVNAWPIGPGQTLEIPLDGLVAQPVVIVAGLADAPVRLDADLIGITAAWGDDDGGSFHSEIVLQPGPERAQRLTDADMSTWVLDGDGFRVGVDVPDLVLRLQHRGGPSAWIRVLGEVRGYDGSRSDGAARLRSHL